VSAREQDRSSALQSSHRLDGHEQDAFSEWRGNEPMPLVESDRRVVDRMHDDRADTSDLRGSGTSPQGIGKQIGAETEALKANVHGKPGNEEQRNLVRHPAPQPGGRERGPLLHGGGDGVIARDMAWSVGIAHDIGAGRGAFAGESPLCEPVIERGMPSILEPIDAMVGVQPLGRRYTASGHRNGRNVRSAIPERLTLHQLFKLQRRRGRRIKYCQKLLMALGVEEEGSLIEDGGLGFPTRARQHEFGEFLAAQQCRTAQQRLEFRSRADLDDVILARRSAPVRTSLCHVSKLLGSIWHFATTLSIHLPVGWRWPGSASLAAIAMLCVPASVSAQGAGQPQGQRQGYWWYEAPKQKPDEKIEPETLAKPVIPPMAELATWTPPKIRKLIEEQRDYAATVLTVDAVADFWRLQDFARRKARAFAGVTQIAMLQYPELNSKSANPMVGDARSELSAEKDAIRRSYLRAHAGEFALVMLSRTTCGYCRVQWPIIQRFQEEMGWQVTLMDLDKRPDLSARFGVEITPTTMIIRRGSQQRMVIASGVEAYPNLAQTAYQAVRLLRGDIRPEQFMTGPGEDAGFFDALGNGPVSATDPRTLGGDLVDVSARPRP